MSSLIRVSHRGARCALLRLTTISDRVVGRAADLPLLRDDLTVGRVTLAP